MAVTFHTFIDMKLRWLLFLFSVYQANGQCSFAELSATSSVNILLDSNCVDQLSKEVKALGSPVDSLQRIINAIINEQVNKRIKSQYYQALIQLSNSIPDCEQITAQCYYAQGLLYYSENDFDSAIKTFKVAAEEWRSSKQVDSVQVGKCYLNIGTCYYYDSQLGLAEKYLAKVRKEVWPISLRHQTRNLNMLGLVNKEKGNTELAEKYFILSGKKHVAAAGDSIYVATKVYRELGSLQWTNKNYDKAEQYFNQSLRILKRNVESKPYIARQIRNEQSNLAATYKAKKDFVRAIQTNLDLLQGGELDSDEKIRISINLGATYFDYNDFVKAEHYFLETQSLLKADPNEEISKALEANKIQLLRANNDFNAAIALQDQALFNCCELRLDSLVQGKYNTVQSAFVVDAVLALQRVAVALHDKYKGQQSKEKWQEVVTYYHAAATLLDQLKTDVFDPKFSTDLGGLNADLAEEVLSLYNDDPHAVSELYEFVEKAKSTSLLASIHAADADEYFYKQYPAIAEVKRLKYEIVKLEKEFIQEELESEKLKLQEEILNLNEDLVDANKERANALSNEVSLRQIYNTTPISEIQKELTPDQTIVSYFITREIFYIFIITQAGIELVRKEYSASHRNNIKELIRMVSDPHVRLNDWVKKNNQVSELLISELDGKLAGNVIIIPDGLLAYLPFESLFTTQVDTTDENIKGLPYLFRQHAISYNFSTSIWHEMSEKKPSGSGLLTMAPEFNLIDGIKNTNGSTAVPLAHAQKEVAAISKVFSSKYRPINKSEFLAQIPKASIIHFAGHAFLNDEIAEDSYLAFSARDDIEDKLFIREIYNLRTPCDLVVLSACNTGQGELKKGEGVMSMARAFAYAGAKSIVYSLWEVNDGSTKKMMEKFYQELKVGTKKDEALRMAKMEYLDNAVGKTQLPYYWAGFVAMGDMSAVQMPNPRCKYLILGLLIAGTVGLVVVRRSKKRSSSLLMM